MFRAFDSVLEAIGNTPLVALDRLCASEGIGPRVFAKLEYYSPGGSVKDRAALKIIEEAEMSGRLRPGQPVVELTSGNMGIGLAVVCAIKNYRLTAVMSEGNTPERSRILRAFGADVVLVPQAKGGSPGNVTKEDLELVEIETQQLVRRMNAFRPDQFVNPDNTRAHEEGTGEEIWSQLKGKVDCFVGLVGTGGTFIGVARALKKHDPSIACYAVEPANAPVLAGKDVVSTKHKLQGGGYAFVPQQWDPRICDGYLDVSDSEAIRYARLLSRKEGILSGFTGGANVAAAVKLAKMKKGVKAIATVIPDTGLKYLSTDLFE
jgi:cysteine synthase A